MTEAATKPKLVSTPPVTDEEWEARLPIPCQYHILVALPDIEDFYQGTSLLKTESEKRREYITSIMGIVPAHGSQSLIKQGMGKSSVL